jgi:hypothetical protein
MCALMAPLVAGTLVFDTVDEVLVEEVAALEREAEFPVDVVEAGGPVDVDDDPHAQTAISAGVSSTREARRTTV